MIGAQAQPFCGDRRFPDRLLIPERSVGELITGGGEEA
jgi:hypothetical protein